MNKQRVAKAARAVLAEHYTASRLTAGGYMLRNKEAVHRDGFKVRVLPGGVVVWWSTVYLIPFRMLGKAERDSAYDIVADYAERLRGAGFVCSVYHAGDGPLPFPCIFITEEPSR